MNFGTKFLWRFSLAKLM